MADVFFKPESMIDSVNVLVRADVVGKFLGSTARTALQASLTPLESWWKAKGGVTDIVWRGAIQTEASSHYQGNDGTRKPIYARIDFEWECSKAAGKVTPCPSGFSRLKKGHVGVVFLPEDDNSKVLKSFHYDVDPDQKNHPFSHLQTNPDVYGLTTMNDIPRWPAILMTPVDVIESVIWDLWPNEWLMNIQQQRVASRLGPHRVAQTSRIEATCESFKKNSAGPLVPKTSALHGIRSPLSNTLQLA